MMKKLIKALLASTLLFGAVGLSASISNKSVTNVKADSTRTYPRLITE